MKNILLPLAVVCAMVSVAVDTHAQMAWKQLMPVLPGGNTGDFDTGSDGLLYARSRSTVLPSNDQGARLGR